MKLGLVVAIMVLVAWPVEYRDGIGRETRDQVTEQNHRVRPHASRSRPSPRLSEPLEAILRCIRRIESGGNYRAVSPSGKYRNGYQMDRSFWLAYGGDPNFQRWEEAPAWMQDQVAAGGYRARGLKPWPVPARKCR